MASNQFSGKKQQKLMRFNEFVVRQNGKERAGLLKEEIIEADITEAMFSMIDGSAPWEDRKQTMANAYRLTPRVNGMLRRCGRFSKSRASV